MKNFDSKIENALFFNRNFVFTILNELCYFPFCTGGMLQYILQIQQYTVVLYRCLNSSFYFT